MNPMLSISNVHVQVAGADVIRGVTLELRAGELCVIMGPNGSGKSTLAYALAGRPGYEVTAGTAVFDGHDLLAMEPEIRARHGLFLGFQYPVEIPGVSNLSFLKAAVNAQREARGQQALDAADFLKLANTTLSNLSIDPGVAKRAVNDGFSGGEKKRNEIFQMVMLKPRLIILDEPDSGMDVDGLKAVAKAIDTIRQEGAAVCVITHYHRLIGQLSPNQVVVLIEGEVAARGDAALADNIEQRGYEWLTPNSQAAAAR